MGSENMRLYWSGPWNGAVFFRLARMFTVTSNNKGAMSCMYVGVATNNMSMLKLTSTAPLIQLSWNQSRGVWGVGWFSALEFCDRYNSCGDNAYCDMKSVSSKTCDCIQGYERIGPNMTSGCVKKTSLTCGSDQFAPLVNMSFPYALNLLQLDAIKDLEGCRMECIKDCRCVASSLSNSLHFNTSSCAYWIDKIQDLRHYKNENGITLHVKLHGESDSSPPSLSPSLFELLCHINRFLFWLSREEEEEDDWIGDWSLSWTRGLVFIRFGFLLLLVQVWV